MIILMLLTYIIVCANWYLFFANKFKKDKSFIFKMPKDRYTYYMLSFTWGLPMNLIGAVVALVLICRGHTPKKYGWNCYFELDVNFGLDLGIFFIAPKNASTHLKNHELGHSIQNVHLGVLTIGVVSIPSALRYWIREFLQHKGKELPDYDAIWFEGSATTSGEAFMSNFEE